MADEVKYKGKLVKVTMLSPQTGRYDEKLEGDVEIEEASADYWVARGLAVKKPDTAAKPAPATPTTPAGKPV